MDREIRKITTMYKALHHRNNIEYMCQERKEEEDSFALKITSTHRYNNSKTIEKEQRVSNYIDQKNRHNKRL